MSQINITVTNPSSTADNLLRLQPYSGNKHQACERLVRMFGAMSCDMQGTSMTMFVDGGTGGVKASGTLTLSSVVATDTAQVGNQTFTASATPSGNNQFLVGLSDTATAANLKAKINAHPAFASATGGSILSAASSGAVVTVTAYAYGNSGNMVQLVGSTDITASGSGYLAGARNPLLILIALPVFFKFYAR